MRSGPQGLRVDANVMHGSTVMNFEWALPSPSSIPIRYCRHDVTERRNLDFTIRWKAESKACPVLVTGNASRTVVQLHDRLHDRQSQTA